MTFWSYTIIEKEGKTQPTLEKLLEQLGERGWELVAVDDRYLYLKKANRA